MKSTPKIQYQVFCDTSFLLTYYFAFAEMLNGIEGSPKTNTFSASQHFPHYRKLRNTIPIVEAVFNYETTKKLVFGFSVVLELIEKIAEYNLKKELIANVPLYALQRYSKKDLSRLADKIIAQCEEAEQYNSETVTPIQQLVYSCFCETDIEFLEEGLFGINYVSGGTILVDKLRLNDIAYLSKRQIGFADISHLLSAEKLGCNYFITYDSDFEFCKSAIERIFGLKVLSKPADILRILTN